MRIFSVGYVFPGGEVDQIEYRSDRTLLDADIIIFQPSFESYSIEDNYQGKPLLYEESSFSAREGQRHWRSELLAAYNAGKTIFIFLPKPSKVFGYTGEKQYSGTGRNRQTTRVVREISNYEALPLSITGIRSSGTEVRLTKDASFLTAYWNEFGSISPYEATFECKVTYVLLETKDGGRVVAASVSGNGKGAFLILPPVTYDLNKLTNVRKSGARYWNAEAIRLGKQLVSALVSITNSIKQQHKVTPAPAWSKESEYRLTAEETLEAKITTTSTRISELTTERAALQVELTAEGALRHLLYEKGKPLEKAVLDAMRLFGLKGEGFADGNSEFDGLLLSEEGKLLIEVEGKDNNAINIDKLSQLERNIQEDFAREGVNSYAKGVLVGNPFRLKTPLERETPFTEKCLSGAKRSSVALIFSPDLFIPAKYLKENDDLAYATLCRQAIFSCSGDVVKFPDPPLAKDGLQDAVSSESKE